MPETSFSPIHSPAHQGVTFDVCDQCQAPLETRQRYCVACGARRLNGDDPAARYFTEITRRARAVEAQPAAAAPAQSSLRTTLILALVPLAAGIGVLAGRSNGLDQSVIDALKTQRAPVVNVGTGAGGAAAADASSSSSKDKSSVGSATGKKTSDGADVIASGPTGDARRLEGSKVTAKQLQESKAAVKKINAAKGKAYIESQRDLPDQIIIP